jgi:hypothetical protein
MSNLDIGLEYKKYHLLCHTNLNGKSLDIFLQSSSHNRANLNGKSLDIFLQSSSPNAQQHQQMFLGK